jgi:membrane-associated phospholipid phosphatase
VVVATVAQGRAVLRGFWAAAWRGWWSLPLVLALSILTLVVFFPLDRGLIIWMHSFYLLPRAVVMRAGSFFGTFGDYPTYNLPLSLGLWLYGWLAGKSSWRRIAVIVFIGGTLAGLVDDCFRLTLGRPRPDARMTDGFYGLPAALSGRFQSFPSGHAAAVFGASTALLFVDVPLGVAATVYSFAVLWARMELYRHFPSDVLVGAMIGIWLGLLVGCGGRLRRGRGLGWPIPLRPAVAPSASGPSRKTERRRKETLA